MMADRWQGFASFCGAEAEEDASFVCEQKAVNGAHAFIDDPRLKPSPTKPVEPAPTGADVLKRENEDMDDGKGAMVDMP